MIIKPHNDMICKSCGKKMTAHEVGYFSTYSELFIVCTDCLHYIKDSDLAELERNFSKHLTFEII